jgi:hypothetical protein
MEWCLIYYEQELICHFSYKSKVWADHIYNESLRADSDHGV